MHALWVPSVIVCMQEGTFAELKGSQLHIYMHCICIVCMCMARLLQAEEQWDTYEAQRSALVLPGTFSAVDCSRTMHLSPGL